MHDRLVQELSRANRLSWAQEECKRYSQLAYYTQDRLQEFLRIKGASGLSRRGLAVLQSLFAWRDKEAVRINRPPRTILPDNILLELSRRPAEKPREISRIRGVRPDQINNYGNQIIDAVKAGLAVPDDECPIWPPFRTPPRREVMLGDMLFAVLKAIVYNLDLAPELVATRADLQNLIRIHREKRLNNSELPVLHGWRRELVGQTMIDLLNGRGLHIWLSNNETPVRFEVDQS